MPALSLLAVFAFLAFLAWQGQMAEGVGRFRGFFALVVNGMINQFGTMGAAGVFAGLGVVLCGAVLFGGRNLRTI
ncbi:MAG: hypothetical protein WBA51_01710 [Erythrobacter sp.]